MGIDEVEGRSLVAEVGEAARALLLMHFNTGVDSLFLVRHLRACNVHRLLCSSEAVAQSCKPFSVDDVREYSVAPFSSSSFLFCSVSTPWWAPKALYIKAVTNITMEDEMMRPSARVISIHSYYIGLLPLRRVP